MNTEMKLGATVTGVGHTYVADFGDTKWGLFVAEITFVSAAELRFEVTRGPFKGHAETFDFTAVELSPGAYLVSWKEPSGAYVTHVHDYERSLVASSVSLPDGHHGVLTGTFSQLR